MRKILKSIKNTASYRKFIIPKSQDDRNDEWVEITIDDTNDVFTAKRISRFANSEEWEELRDYTFPSSLLNEFLNTTNKSCD